MTMNAKELADRVVALGYGRIMHNGTRYQIPVLERGSLYPVVTAEAFINDGRVMLALMEKCSHIDAYWDDTGWSCDVVGSFAKRGLGSHDGLVGRTALCPAILEACCEALENGQ